MIQITEEQYEALLECACHYESLADSKVNLSLPYHDGFKQRSIDRAKRAKLALAAAKIEERRSA